MSETKKRKPFDMATVLNKTVVVNTIPSITHRGKPRIDWTPLINMVKQKGIVRLSQDDVNVSSVMSGVKKEAEKQKLDIVVNTRKIDGKIYLFLQKPIKK